MKYTVAPCFITIMLALIEGLVDPQSRSALAFETTRTRHFSTVTPAADSTYTTTSNMEPTRVILKRNPQSKAFRNGSQLVFTRAIQRFEGLTGKDPQRAELVQILVDDSPKPVALGWGVYNPDSLYRVRILCHRFLQPNLYQTVSSSPNTDTALRCILRHHFHKAWATRQALQLPQAGFTDTFRLVNGEGDQLSGLAVDIVGSVAVVMSSAAWSEIYRSLITECLLEQLPEGTSIVWKTTPNRLKQDGFDFAVPEETEGDVSVADKADQETEGVISIENGIRYRTFPFSNGQKTGVYCDQRENRWNIAQLCRGKRVLDLCCFHGGFSLNAMINGGALSCTGVDSSEDAIFACRNNAKLNECTEDRLQFVRADIGVFLRDTADTALYDVVILDPPKLAPTAAGLDKARRKYPAFNRDAIKVVAPEGGLLLTCTCSAAMTQKDGGKYFLQMVQGAAQATGREVTLLRVSGAASCHTQSPISWPAGAYLTAALFYVHPTAS